MFLFRRNPPPKKYTYKRKTEEQLEKEQTRKEKQWAREKLLEKAKDNPDLENQYIAKLMNIEIKPPDPTQEYKREAKLLVTKEALDELKNDPELRREFARSHIGDLIGGSRYTPSGSGDGYEGSAISIALQQLDELEEFQNRTGGKKGGILGGLIDANVITEVLRTLRGAQAGGSQERTFVVTYNGQPTEVTESQYNEMVRRGLIQPATAFIEEAFKEPDAPHTPEEETPRAEFSRPEQKEPELPAFLSMLDLSVIAGYFEMPPEEAVMQLGYEVEAGEEQPVLIWAFLSTATYKQIAEFVAPYKDHSEIGYHVQKLLESKEWLEKAIELIKETVSATE